jgi:hypothetical protein
LKILRTSSCSGAQFKRARGLTPARSCSRLDGIDLPSSDEGSWEAGSFYARILVRAWRGPDAFDPARAVGWLRKRAAFISGRGGSRARDLRAAMRDTTDRLRALAKDFFGTVPIDADRWLAYHRFREAILYELNADALADIVVDEMDATEPGSDRRLFLYDVGFSLSYQAEAAHGAAVFDDLYARADHEVALVEARAAATVCNLPPNYFAGWTGVVRAEDSRERQRQAFDQDVQQIHTGAHLGWLTHLSHIYFALYGDVDRSSLPASGSQHGLAKSGRMRRSRHWLLRSRATTCRASPTSWR